jgi:hypothetical protein
MHAVRSWVLWWLVLFGVWNLMQGAWEEMEIAAGAGAAALGATFAEVARRQGLLSFAPPAETLAKGLGAPWRLIYEYGVLTWVVLARVLRVHDVRSVWLAVPYDGGAADPVSRGRRAAAVLIENISPNTIGVDVDCDGDVALRHDLDPRFGSSGFPS